jgi:hypothetical protein
MDSPTIQDQNPLSVSYDYENNFDDEPRKEGLTSKLRQTITAAGKLVQPTARQRKVSAPNLSNLTSQCQVRYPKKAKKVITRGYFLGTYFTCC